MSTVRARAPLFLLILFVSMVLSACTGPRVYIHPSPGLDRIKQIAVLPFENYSKDAKAGEKIRSSFVIELLRTRGFGVLDPGETDRRLLAAGLSYTAVPTTVPAISLPAPEEEATASEPLSRVIGKELGVQALFVGSVDTYNVERVGEQIIPEIGVSARLIDAETGIIIWAATYSQRGSTGIPIVGWGKMTSLSKLRQQVVQEMIHSLAEYIY